MTPGSAHDEEDGDLGSAIEVASGVNTDSTGTSPVSGSDGHTSLEIALQCNRPGIILPLSGLFPVIRKIGVMPAV